MSVAREPAWVGVAQAAAPWPLAGLALLAGLSASRGGALHGGLAFALVFLALTTWLARPPMRVWIRWASSVVAVGVTIELLAFGLTKDGGAPVAALADPARALLVWLLAVGLFELAPQVAVASRLRRDEPRRGGLDLVAHLLFIALAIGAWVEAPRVGAGAWWVSPWVTAACVLPLAAARCVDPAALRLPSRAARGPLVGLSAMGVGLAVAIVAHDGELAWAMGRRALRYGVAPVDGALLATLAAAAAFALVAAGALALRALRTRRLPSGEIVGREPHGLVVALVAPAPFRLRARQKRRRNPRRAPTPTLPRERGREISADSSVWVRCETAGRPELRAGEPVTLLGARHAPADEGPFREAEALDVALVFAGDHRALRDALLSRGALYLAGAAAAMAALTLTLSRL